MRRRSPWVTRETRPTRGVLADLLLVDLPRRQSAMRAQMHGEDIAEPEGGVEPQATMVLGDADAAGRRSESIDGIRRADEGRAGHAELRFVPQVHTGLIADLNRSGGLGEDLSQHE